MYVLTVTIYLAAQIHLWRSAPLDLAACTEMQAAVIADATYFPLPPDAVIEAKCETTKE